MCHLSKDGAVVLMLRIKPSFFTSAPLEWNIIIFSLECKKKNSVIPTSLPACLPPFLSPSLSFLLSLYLWHMEVSRPGNESELQL